MPLELYNRAMAEAVRRGLSVLTTTSREILVDVVGAIRGIPQFFESQFGVVMSFSK